jgi:PAS domain S-box-containing protein
MSRKPDYEELEKRIQELEQESQLRRNTKGALRKYDLIFSAVQDPMGYIDKNYTCLAVNDVFLTMFGRSRNEIVGKKLKDLMGKKSFDNRLIWTNAFQGKRQHSKIGSNTRSWAGDTWS